MAVRAPKLLGIFIAQIYSGLRREELTPTQPDLDAQAAPNGPVFRAYGLGAEDDPLSTIADELKRQHDRRTAVEDLDTKVRAGELPLGMLAVAIGCSYAETRDFAAKGQATILHK